MIDSLSHTLSHSHYTGGKDLYLTLKCVIAELGTLENHLAKALNRCVSLFLKDLLSIMDRGVVMDLVCDGTHTHTHRERERERERIEAVERATYRPTNHRSITMSNHWITNCSNTLRYKPSAITSTLCNSICHFLIGSMRFLVWCDVCGATTFSLVCWLPKSKGPLLRIHQRKPMPRPRRIATWRWIRSSSCC
jgi:hypothetical protein